VASRVVEHIAQIGLPSISGTVEITRDPGTALFCERNGFERTDSLTTVEADMDALRTYAVRLRERIGSRPDARIVPLRAAPREQVAELHARYVAQEGELNQWRGLMSQTPEMDISPVAMVDERVIGILLGTVEGTTAVVRTRVVAPGYHGTWVNALLLAEALETGWKAGARRARFSYTELNRDTQKLAARSKAEVVSVVALFIRRNTGRMQ
jgi:hypothetical protein